MLRNRPCLLVLGLFLLGCSAIAPRATRLSDVVEVSDQSFQAEVLESSAPVLVDFWAPWCGPCRMVGPIVDEVATEYKDSVKVCKVNIDDCPLVSAKYEVAAIPTLLIFKSGEVKQRMVGVQSKEHLQAALEDAR